MDTFTYTAAAVAGGRTANVTVNVLGTHFELLKKIAVNWLDKDCGLCNGADLNGDHEVNMGDICVLSQGWLAVN